jgi:hypothetical protein
MRAEPGSAFTMTKEDHVPLESGAHFPRHATAVVVVPAVDPMLLLDAPFAGRFPLLGSPPLALIGLGEERGANHQRGAAKARDPHSIRLTLSFHDRPSCRVAGASPGCGHVRVFCRLRAT